MTTDLMEPTTAQSQVQLRYAPHVLEAPKPHLEQIFYPFGFPVLVRTNAREILSLCADSWDLFAPRFDTEPIQVQVHVHIAEDEFTPCPPSPTHRILQPYLLTVADADNYSIVDLARGTSQIVVSSAALRHAPYLQYFFLEAAALCHIATRHSTPVHAGCVAFDGRGVLLCGDSGAGKSTLAWACARAGWAYTSDDGSLLLHNQPGRVITGNCHKVRLRPAATEFFPEIAGFTLTPRAEGKPSIELSTRQFLYMRLAPSAPIDFIVFLNRKWDGPAQLVPQTTELARRSMQTGLFAAPEFRALQHAAIERLLTVPIFELRYSSLQSAIDRLRTLTREGR